MGKKKIRINFFSRLQSKKSTPPSLDGGVLIRNDTEQRYYKKQDIHSLNTKLRDEDDDLEQECFIIEDENNSKEKHDNSIADDTNGDKKTQFEQLNRLLTENLKNKKSETVSIGDDSNDNNQLGQKELEILQEEYTKLGYIPVPVENEIDKTKKHLTIMVIGQTGVGKTTLLNSMVNYLWDVKYDDKRRYKLTYEKKKEGGCSVSNTDNVTAYHLNPPKLDYQLSVIDTPGFGDTRGIERDKINMEKTIKFLKNYPGTVDAICFVIKSSENRLTGSQEYIYINIEGLLKSPNINE